MPEVQTFKKAIMPILVANFVSGQGCFVSHRKYPGKFFEFAYSAIYLLIFCLLITCVSRYVNAQDFRYTLSNSYQKINMLNYCNFLLMILLVIAARFRSKKMRIAIEMIETCDRKMENMGLPKCYYQLYRRQLYVLGICMTIVMLMMVISYEFEFFPTVPITSKLIYAIVSNMPLLLIEVSNTSFYMLIRYTSMKFYQLNNLLREMLTTTPNSPRQKRISTMHDFDMKITQFRNDAYRSENRNANTMRAVKQTHLELIKIVRTINDAFGLEILLMMIISFIFIVCLLYTCYRLIWLELPINELLAEITPPLCWILIYMIKIFFLNSIATKATTVATDAGDIICELYEPSATKEFRIEIRDFTLQLIQNPLMFTICGFFNLDHSFIQRIVGTIATYLIILLQVGDPPQPIQFSNETSTTPGTT